MRDTPLHTHVSLSLLWESTDSLGPAIFLPHHEVTVTVKILELTTNNWICLIWVAYLYCLLE